MSSSVILWSGYRFPYNLTRHWLRPSTLVEQVRHIVQRARYGVSDYDQLSFDGHLEEMLACVLPNFKNTGKHGEHIVMLLPGISIFEEHTQADMDAWDATIDRLLVRLKAMNDDDAPYLHQDLDWFFDDLKQVWQCLWH